MPTRRSRPSLLPLAVALLPLAACSDPERAPAPVEGTGRSVLFVLVDTLRLDHTSVVEHRHGRRTTPFLDWLAEESWVFERAYTPASWTRATMASIFTSRIPAGHGCIDRDGVLSPELVTWAEALKDAGYETRGVITNGNVLSIYGFDQGFDTYRHVKDFPRNAYADAWKLREPVIEAIDRSIEPPWFVYAHYVDPHDPFTPHEDPDFSPGYEGPMDGSRDALDPYRWEPPPDPADRQRVLDLYDGEILWFDRELEALFARLEPRGVLDEAWIVVTSDHGEGMWDHRIQSHGQEVYEEQIRVPLIIRPPGGLDVSVRVPEPMSLVDLAPTMLDLVDVEIPAGFHGRSWAARLTGDGPAPVRPIIVDETLENVQLAAIIDGEDKLILDWHSPKGELAGIVKSAHLFDLATNPREQLDRALDVREVRSARAASLERRLLEALREAEQRRPDVVGTVEESDEQLAALRALGYLGDELPDDAEDGEDAADEAPGGPDAAAEGGAAADGPAAPAGAAEDTNQTPPSGAGADGR